MRNVDTDSQRRGELSPAVAFVAVTLGMFLTAGHSLAAEHKGPDFYGNATIGALNVEDRDVDLWAFEANVGVRGQYVIDDGLRFIYELEAEMAGAVNDTDEQTWSLGEVDPDNNDDIYVSTARIMTVTDYGTLVLAPRLTAGQWVQLYGNIDRFEYNRFHGQTGKISIFGQKYHASDIIAYATPDIVPGLKLLAASSTQDDRNGEDFDTYAVRLVYRDEGLRLGVGHAVAKNEQLPTDEDYQYTTLSAGVDVGALSLDAVYEMDRDSVLPRQGQPPTTADFDSFVATAAYEFLPSWTGTLGLARKDHDEDELDVEGVIVNLKKQLDENVYVFAETGQYDDAPDNIAAGISLSF